VDEEITNVYPNEMPSRYDWVPRSEGCLHESLSICHKEELDMALSSTS
jgi:hypothetical protein